MSEHVQGKTKVPIAKFSLTTGLDLSPTLHNIATKSKDFTRFHTKLGDRGLEMDQMQYYKEQFKKKCVHMITRLLPCRQFLSFSVIGPSVFSSHDLTRQGHGPVASRD